jgi:hypothetical protein
MERVAFGSIASRILCPDASVDVVSPVSPIFDFQTRTSLLY